MLKIIRHITLICALVVTGGLKSQVLDTICAIGNPSHLAVNPTPGSNYTWSVQNGTILSGQGTNDILVQWNIGQGLYRAQVVEENSNGCTGDVVEAFVNLRLPEQSLINGPDIVCKGSFVELIGYNGKNAQWNNGDTSEVVGFFAVKDTTIYRVVYNWPCENDTFYHHLTVLDKPTVAIQSDMNGDTLIFGDVVNFTYTGTAAQSVNWYVNGTYYETGLTLYLNDLLPGMNEILAEGVTGDCADSVLVNVMVRKEFKVHIPTGFSPNGDGINDLFFIDGVGIGQIDAHIYDRWGHEVAAWTENSEVQGWDGTTYGQPSEPGVYTYRFHVYEASGRFHEYYGSLQLLR